ncbi:hypothetical protein [Deinococcus sp. QL22]|uniref:hypothetical protein n=1 Tax=Deinococcus sp. QL22 TaxID=2939437 RepID=UPI002017635A|nr:hypothetical protein [Deinococcus sp. QL22]UQN04986.1 hypothetical protein M1R55_08670 [Deinococcus sp. QL22]
MNKKVLIRFVPPAPIKIAVSKGVSRTRDWNTDKLVGFLQEGLEIWAADAYPELELNVVDSRQAEIRFEGWKPDKESAAEMREAIGQQMGLVLEGIEPDEYLSE